jgi:hypothetical protein
VRFLRRKDLQRLGREARGDQHLDELLGDERAPVASSSQLNAMMPPNADVGSVFKALA